MNPEAKAFFEANPNEPYWYYSDNVRVPNPKMKPWRQEPRVPWPHQDGCLCANCRSERWNNGEIV